MRVRVTPRAGRDAVGGTVCDAAGRIYLQIRVTAPPDGGRANAAVVRLLARAVACPASAIRVLSGETARWKRLSITAPPAQLAARLQALARG